MPFTIAIEAYLQRQQMLMTHPKYGTSRPLLDSSVDYLCGPLRNKHRRSACHTLVNLPPELLYSIFDCLDPVDSTCLGLTARHFYAIHHQIYGSVPLNCRRLCPNDLEWAWRRSSRAPDDLRVQGQVFCRKCGICRCELHRHLRTWMGADNGRSEYCQVSQRFGPPAANGVSEFCYLCSPRWPQRCGRHSGNRGQCRRTPTDSGLSG